VEGATMNHACNLFRQQSPEIMDKALDWILLFYIFVASIPSCLFIPTIWCLTSAQGCQYFTEVSSCHCTYRSQKVLSSCCYYVRSTL